jgi:uncharacterized protein (TIGR03083 family)
MDKNTITSWLEAERLSLADFLDGLTPQDWQAATLCPEWTVHEMAAHLALSTKDTLLGTIRGVIRARGDWNLMNTTSAREHAARHQPAELIQQIRETAGSARRAPGAGRLDPLVDALVHGQDIARPLGLTRELPAEQTVAALEHVRGSAFYGAKRRFAGTRLVATDTDWSGGDGPDEIHGPVGDLLLVATGRAAGLAGLSGRGLDRVAAGPEISRRQPGPSSAARPR